MPTNDDDWGEPQTNSNIWDLEEGPLVGVYLGYKEVNSDYGLSQLHNFDCEDGKYSVWGKAHLNRLLEGRIGELVKIALTGEKINLGGGRSMIEYVLWSKGRVGGGPALPQTPLPASQGASPSRGGGEDPFPQGGPEEAADEAARIRARRLAIACKDAQIDDEMRGELINWYTFGETSSAKDLNEKQFTELYSLVQKIRRGKAELRYDEKGELYVDGGGR